MTGSTIIGVGMTSFGRYPDQSLKAIGGEAIRSALADADIAAHQVQIAYVASAGAGLVTGQACILGQVLLRSIGIDRIPVINVENACASASTAFQQAVTMVELGACDIALAVGIEKLFHADKQRTFSVFRGSTDVDDEAGLHRYLASHAALAGKQLEAPSPARSIFMDIYAAKALRHMAEFGTTQRDFAAIAAKNSLHGSLNPRAQFRKRLTTEDVLGAPLIQFPLTLPMCSPIGDGAAAAIVVSERKARELGRARGVRVIKSLLVSGYDSQDESHDTLASAAAEIYSVSGVSPQDLQVVELHDATAPAELMQYEALQLAAPGEGRALIADGVTALGGRIPVNTSGGLLRKGHPIGATGLAQIFEIVTQLRGEAAERQVPGAKIGLAENGGGLVRGDVAASVLTIMEGA